MKHERGFVTHMEREPNLRLAKECGYVAIDRHDGAGFVDVALFTEVIPDVSAGVADAMQKVFEDPTPTIQMPVRK